MAFAVAAGGVSVNGDDDGVAAAVDDGPFVGTQAAFVQGDIVGFVDEKGGVEAVGAELCCHAAGDFSVLDAFADFSVGAAFAGSVDAVAGVDKDFHCCICSMQLSASGMKIVMFDGITSQC